MIYKESILSFLVTIIIIWSVVGCAGTQTPEPASPPTAFPRSFHVMGNAIVDDAGQKMIFRGMAPVDPFWQIMHGDPAQNGIWSIGHYSIMAEWGANIIRLPIVPGTFDEYVRLHGEEAAFQVLDQTIAWAGANHMYVIIDFHSVGWPEDNFYPSGFSYETTIDEIKKFWVNVSSRYKNNNTVAFYELFNEPQKGIGAIVYTAEDWGSWKSFMEKVINVIRANENDQHKIILVAGVQNAYDLEYALPDPVSDPYNNVAYVVHPYPTMTLPGWDEAFGNLSRRHPVIATEFNYSDSADAQQWESDRDINGIPYHQEIIEYMESHNISWVVWVFDVAWEIPLLKDIHGYVPNYQGEYFRGRLLEFNHPTLGQVKGTIVLGSLKYQEMKNKLGVEILLALMKRDPLAFLHNSQQGFAVVGHCIKPNDRGEFLFTDMTPGSYILGAALVDSTLNENQNCSKARPLSNINNILIQARQVTDLGQVNVTNFVYP